MDSLLRVIIYKRDALQAHDSDMCMHFMYMIRECIACFDMHAAGHVQGEEKRQRIYIYIYIYIYIVCVYVYA
jgi:hypothetical protein